DFDGLNIHPVQELTTLEVADRPIYAGVNSFGFGGANATVILREHIAEPRPARMPPAVVPPLILSARSPAALQQMAKRFGDLIAKSADDDFYDIAYTAAFRRARLKH